MMSALKNRAWLLFLSAFLVPASVSPALVRPQAVTAVSAYLATPITVTLNPYGIAPLAAIAEFTTKFPCNVTVEVQGEIPIVKDFKDESTAHSIPIIGLYPGRINTVVLMLYRHHGTPEVQALSIATAPLPDFFPILEVNTSIPALMEPGFNVSDFAYFAGNVFIVTPFIFDARGQVRAYFSLAATPGQAFPFERMANGNFIYGVGTSVYEIDIMGRLRNKLTTPGYTYHHDIRELPDGNLIAAVNKAGTQIVNSHGVINSIEDCVIQLNRTTGAIMNEWDMRALLDVRRNEVINSVGDWFHMNSVWYSAADDCLILSGRHQGVVKVTRNNTLKWILAGHDGWGNAGWDGSGPATTPYLLTAVDATGAPYDDIIQNGLGAAPDFDWTWGQHDAHLLPNGNFVCFDNGFRRLFSDLGPYYSRTAEYIIDEKARTVRQVWQYGKERGMDLYATIISSVDRLPTTGNRLMAPGIVQLPTQSYAKVVEVTFPAGQVVFEATAYLRNLYVPATGGFDIVYRSRRIPSLYP
jgi:arylsulfate sulfotransferase